MGNSRWRLETSLNFTAQKISELGKEEEVEILVADWGSEIPLREVVQLTPAAARMVSFLLIPPEIARDLQKDSPFPEVLALNAAARRATGEYIGRIDQDTLVGKRFLQMFFELYEGERKLVVPLSSALLFSNLRMVPYRLAVRCPSLPLVEWFISNFGRRLEIEITTERPFYGHGVGIWLLHRDVWNDCGGYDERMIYMNGMETNMLLRLLPKYEIINLGELTDYDFYHLEHYHPWQARKSSVHRKVNRRLPFSRPDASHPDSTNWGLVEYSLGKNTVAGHLIVAAHRPQFELLLFIIAIVRMGSQIVLDTLSLRALPVYTTWTRRVRVVCHRVYGEPVLTWPSLVKSLWIGRSSVRAKNILPEVDNNTRK